MEIKLKEARQAAGLTQTQLADKIGKKQKDISRWENGERTPSLPSLLLLAEALECSVNDIISGQ